MTGQQQQTVIFIMLENRVLFWGVHCKDLAGKKVVYLCLEHFVFQGKKKQQLNIPGAGGWFISSHCLSSTSDVKDHRANPGYMKQGALHVRWKCRLLSAHLLSTPAAGLFVSLKIWKM